MINQVDIFSTLRSGLSFWGHIGNVDGLPPFLISEAPKAKIAICEPFGQLTLTRFSKAFFSASGYLGSLVIEPEKSTRITTSAEFKSLVSSANT